jgi:hypothetical protein
VTDAEQCGLHRDAHDAAIPQPLQFGAAGVVVDHSDTLEPAVAPSQEVQ